MKSYEYKEFPVIHMFMGEYRFLSNFYSSPMTINGEYYISVEHFYQSEKTTNMKEKYEIINASSPQLAKKLGQMVKDIDIDYWNSVKYDRMYLGVISKFKQNIDLKLKLLDTRSSYLIEGNWWKDTYWGFDINLGYGENKLGEILMKVRNELK